ncbi:Uu.00g018050.m01.CDS01 [Anthostomella pinea]|uniref:Uu.00g018050.m01.CDS01 n=1 Tax=Anthostomella pinea TaxID=933095 RepID=A0AAI8YQP9_9PEZI|nr:Uu.00g018050.m01.CDS01 [Anthostomella pinea]
MPSSPLLTSLSHHVAPSQKTLPDLQDPLKFSPRSASRLNSFDFDDDSDGWETIGPLRPLIVDPSASATSRAIAHSRESSLEKLQSGGLAGLAGIPESPRSASSSRSAGLRSPTSRQGLGGILDRLADQKTGAYGHHRQTSIVHGIQHSRNGSLSSSSSPLSPQMIAAVGAGMPPERPEMPTMPSMVRQDSDLSTGSRPPTAMSGTTANTTSQPLERTLSVSESGANTLTQRRVVRTHSRARRDHAHQQSHSSRHHKDEQKTVGEYALHVLFTSFIAHAEEKLNECITVPFDPEPPIEQICGPGADPAFDQFIVALGHIASPKPKSLIDSIMLWRKYKSEAANEARSQLQQLRTNFPSAALVRRNTEPLQMMTGNGSSEASTTNGPTSLAAKQEYVAQAERRSIVSIYILCRVLLEVISQSNLSCITPEMEDKLEGIIFGQLKIADVEQLYVSPLKLANWNLFSQLLGAMSEINFASVSDRFIVDLERSLQDLGARSPTTPNRDPEGQVELVLGGMKYLRIKIDTDENWHQACDFLVSLGRLFARSHGQKVKSAFCQILDTLIIPIAAKATNNHFTYPRWAEVLSNISPRLASMFVKPRHWSAAFPLTSTMLCVSPPENSSNQWLQLVRTLQPRLKDRTVRPLCLQAISRLLWTYLYRTNDSSIAVTRKLDEVMQLVLPTTKRTFSAADTASSGPLIQIIRIIGYRYPEFCCKNVIFPLINAELFNSNKELKVEQLEPDRMVIGIRAFLVIMADLEKGELGRPPFPQQYSIPSNSDRVPPNSPASTSTQSPSLGTPLMPHPDESLSRPVQLGALGDGARDYYKKFSEILGKITIICDNTFGGQAALDEKFSSPGPKTPIAETFNFSRRDDHQSPADQKQAFYELLHVAVQALPRCLSADIPFNSLINLLCTGTAHVQWNIAQSSAQSLKSIAKQSHAHQVTMGFARFIFNFDDRYSTMSDGGMLGPGHIENTLRLYVELLQIWRDEIRQKTKDAATDPTEISGNDKRGMKLDLSSIWAEVEHVEARGLFFLCSQSRRVRYYAITVLRLIVEFDTALGKDRTQEKDNFRLIDILENDSVQVMSFKDEHLSVAERSRLQRGMQNSNNKGALIDLCTSDVSYDTTLWFKIFPNLIRIAYDRCPFTVTIGRDLICNRILQMYKAILQLSEPSRGLYYGSDPNSARFTGRTPTTQPEVLVEQWKLYLTFACTTLADPGSAMNGVLPGSQHLRKGSKSTDKIVSARILFKYLIPLLSVSSASVREAVVLSMGSVNINIYRTLLEELQGQVSRCNDEARHRLHQRSNSGPRRNRKMDLLWTELTHVYKLTSHFLKDPEACQDDWILNNLCVYTKDLKLFLMDGEVQMDWEFQKLRRHYCGLMEELFEGINRTKDPSRWMTFESRKSSFALMEDWCGFSPNQQQIRQREDTMRQSLIDQQSLGERGTATAAMEIEKRNLGTAALSAMAALCAGPVSVTTESGVVLQFDVRRMLAWIETIFNSGSDRINVIGRRALKNLIIYNQGYPYLLEHCIARCYLAEAPKVLESYFAVITEVLLERIDYPSQFWKLLALCLFTLGNDQSDIRSKSARVLRALEERQQTARNSKIQDFDISISDKTKAVYKLAQFEISKRLAKQHPEVAFHIFSEFTLYFKSLEPFSQRNAVAVILPWIQTIELKVDPNGGPIAQSYVLLANLLEITIKSSAALHNEVQALWQALATGPHPGNVRLVLDFIISLCLERREQNFVEYAKQIVVFLSSTPSTPGIKVVEFLLMQISPKAMVPNEKREIVPPPPDINQLPYCADLSEALPVGTKQAGFSLGQLSLILLVDLMVAPVQLSGENLPVLLQVVTVLWDHYTPLVQEQAREMLVHLIHELVISKMDDATPVETKSSIEDVIEAIRCHDRSVVWSYEDSNGKVDDRDSKVPHSMEYLTAEVVKTFEVTFPGIKEQWSRLSLTWATSCPVRHLACRSFQIFRCILTSVDQLMLGDMLARLSNTIADEDTEIQTFSMEILTTLKTLVAKLEPEKLLSYPQLFWTTCACLESINELEFLEAIEMLDIFLDKLDFHSPNIRQALLDGQPPRWDGVFEGIQPLLYKGLRSSICLQPTLNSIEKLVQLPSDALIGSDDRLFFAILANFPQLLQAMEQGFTDDGTLQTAGILLEVAEAQGLSAICESLSDFIDSRYQSSRALMVELFAALREFYLPQLDFKMITMLMGFLTNSLSSVKIMTMRLLCVIIPETEMRKPEIAGHGSDLLSPLLRLLQTEFCMEALVVLDNVVAVSGSSMDKHHLRMSMTRSSSKAIRKEYERTQSLFGIPEESGWAIPVPAKKTDATRANIHAAFYMCQADAEDGIPTDPTPTPEVEFHADHDYRYGYFEMPERTETMMSDEARGEGHMGDLVMKLDSLDDFFDDMSQTSPSEARSSRTVTEFTAEGYESGARLYDDVLPILHQASTNTSFHNGFVDRLPVPRETNTNTMNPAAFNPEIATRPALHSRSITLPSAPGSYQTNLAEFTSDDELTEDVFSDGDDDGVHVGRRGPGSVDRGGGHMATASGTAGESSFFLENMIRPIAQSTRTHMRRLTGGRSRDAERQRELFRAGVPSPQVPKVPSSFLTQTQTQMQTKPTTSPGDML